VVVSETGCSRARRHPEGDGPAIKTRTDGLVVASCSPKLHQITSRVLETSGLPNPILHPGNVREQFSWVTPMTTRGRPRGNRPCAGWRRQDEVVRRSSRVFNTLPIDEGVGGGVAGLRAAVGLADIGLGVVIVERASQVGGGSASRSDVPNERSGREQIDFLVAEVAKRPSITVLTDAELVSKSGSFGNYVTQVRVKGQRRWSRLRLDHRGRTGFDTYQPEVGEFGYGIEGVVTLPEFTKLVDGSTPG